MSFPPAPGWVEQPDFYTGLDVTGLRAPVQRVSDDALNGITTVTPALRYVGFYCWIVRNYWQQRRPDDGGAFWEFVSLCEFAIVVGNRLQPERVTGLLGASKADSLLGAGDDPLVPQELVTGNVASTYGAIVGQLGLTDRSAASAVPPLVAGRGDLLANAVGASLEATALGRRLAAEGPPATMTRAELAELGLAAKLDVVPTHEREVLEAVLLPREPLNAAERRRLGSYGLMLLSAETEQKRPAERSFLKLAASSAPVPAALRPARVAWSYYQTRDSLAVLHELALQRIVGEVERLGGNVDSRVAVGSLIGADPQARGLQKLGLIDAGVTVEQLTCGLLWGAIEAATGDAVEEDGRLAWSGGLSEWALRDAARAEGDSVGALLVVAWMLAVRRNAPALAGTPSRSVAAARAGSGQLGLAEVIAPVVERWRAEDTRLVSAIAELLYRTVDQHLRIVWSRRAADPRRDAARLAVDGANWRSRGGFWGGRSGNTLGVAAGWLETLGLVGDDGLTEAGERAYAEVLATLGGDL